MKKVGFVSVVATAVAACSGFLIPTAHAGEPGAGTCPAVEVLQIAGTDHSRSWTDEINQNLFGDDPSTSVSVGDLLAERFEPGTVRKFQVPYPATSARLQGLNPKVESNELASYGESSTIGLSRSLQRMAATHQACPATKFMLLGYSQGADIAGMAAARVASGAAEGMDADDIAAVALVADPGRAPVSEAGRQLAPQSTLYGPVPAGTLADNGELIITGNTSLNASRVGMRGARLESLNPLQGKLVSYCNAQDLVCNTPPNSAVPAVAAVAAKQRFTEAEIGAAGARFNKLETALRAGTSPRAAIRESGITQRDMELVRAIGPEVSAAAYTAVTQSKPNADLVAVVRMIRQFVTQHTSYFQGDFRVDGMTTSEHMLGWLEQVTKGVLRSA